VKDTHKEEGERKIIFTELRAHTGDREDEKNVRGSAMLCSIRQLKKTSEGSKFITGERKRDLNILLRGVKRISGKSKPPQGRQRVEKEEDASRNHTLGRKRGETYLSARRRSVLGLLPKNLT